MRLIAMMLRPSQIYIKRILDFLSCQNQIHFVAYMNNIKMIALANSTQLPSNLKLLLKMLNLVKRINYLVYSKKLQTAQ